jgi:hypothetical protein
MFRFLEIILDLSSSYYYCCFDTNAEEFYYALNKIFQHNFVAYSNPLPNPSRKSHIIILTQICHVFWCQFAVKGSEELFFDHWTLNLQLILFYVEMLQM